jgi:putative membrane protein
MQIWFIFSLLFSLIVATFAVLNSDLVTIKLFWVDYELSQSIVIIFSAVLGATIVFFLGLFSKIKSSLKIRELTSDIKDAEKKIALLTSSVKGYEEKSNIPEQNIIKQPSPDSNEL